MQEDEGRNKLHKIKEKVPTSSGFTPEHTDGERFVLMQKKKQQQKVMKNLLAS